MAIDLAAVERVLAIELREALEPDASGSLSRPPGHGGITGRHATDALVAAAAWHGVLGLLSDRWPPGVVERRTTERARTLGTYVRAVSALEMAGRVFSRSGIRFVAVKGAVLAPAVYPHPNRRPFADVDLLVSPADFRRSIELLEGEGARLLLRNWRWASDRVPSEMSVLAPSGVVIDLHWDLVNRAVLRRRFSFDTSELLASSVPVISLPGVRTLPPAEAFVHVCWHATMAGSTRLIWAADVELLARRLLEHDGAAAARAVASAAARTGTQLPVGIALDWAAEVFPAGGASQLQKVLPGSLWRSVAALALARGRAGRAGPWSGQVFARSARSGSISSLAAAAAHVSARANRGDSGDQVDVLQREDGGASARESYFRKVAAARP